MFRHSKFWQKKHLKSKLTTLPWAGGRCEMLRFNLIAQNLKNDPKLSTECSLVQTCGTCSADAEQDGVRSTLHPISDLMNLQNVRLFSIELNFALRLSKVNTFMNRIFQHGKRLFVPPQLPYWSFNQIWWNTMCSTRNVETLNFCPDGHQKFRIWGECFAPFSPQNDTS